jgi:hypothetical protein
VGSGFTTFYSLLRCNRPLPENNLKEQNVLHRYRRRVYRFQLAKALNERGENNIIAIGQLKGDKFRNLADCEIADYLIKRTS